MRTSRSFFSLLEIMVGLALVLMAAGTIGWKIQGLVEKKRFSGDLAQLKSRILTTQRMAVNMQADWEGILKRDGKNWTFETVCLDPLNGRSFSPLKLHFSQVFFEGQEKSRLNLSFFSSGEVWPIGALQFRSSKDKKSATLELPGIFGKSVGSGSKKLGPVHPDDA
jgi:hypothetical protein